MKITWDEFCLICRGSKPSNFKPPNWDTVETNVATKLSVEQDSLLHDKLVELKTRYNRFASARRNKGSDQRDVPCTDVVLDSEDFVPITIPEAEVPKKKPKKSLDQLGQRQLKTRTEEIWLQVQQFAEENGETPLRILALLLRKCQDQGARQFGESVWHQSAPSKSKISDEAALSIMVDCQLGRDTYSKLGKTLKKQGYDILPPWIQLRGTQTSISPKPYSLPHPHEGVQMNYAESMKITAERIMKTIPPSILPSSVVMNIKFGFDGSGSHAIYRQLENTKTNNIIMSMFCPLSINDEDGEVKWSQAFPNSALTHRPLALQLGKESRETLQSLEVFDDDINRLQSEGFQTVVEKETVSVKVNVSSHIMDMKAANLYLGLGGAYCDLCDHSRAECHDPDVVKAGFEITRSVADLHTVFEAVSDENGDVVKHRDDYSARKGLTNKPIPNHEVISVQVLHALLRTFDHYMKIAVHLKAEVFEWTESEASRYHKFLVATKKEIQSKLEEVLGERWDFPDGTGKGGTSTTGNTARNILHHGGREIVIQMLPSRFQPVMTQIGQYLSVVLRLFSSSQSINVAEYKKVCTSLYLLYLESFPKPVQPKTKSPKPIDLMWVSVPPTLHKLLAHSWELIEMNECRGLKCFDESGLEANNKILRSIRLKLARKNSQTNNLTDTINRLWIGSDPIINNIRLQNRPYCKHCEEYGHSTRYCKVAHPVFGPSNSDDALLEKLCC